jgi:hypothetical protein
VSRFRIFTLFAALMALGTAFAACGGGSSSDPQTVLDEATLQGIESGNVDLSLGIDVKGSEGGHLDVGLSGPFRSESEAEYPELDMSASAKGSLGGEKVDFEGGLTLLGNKAYVGYEGTEYEVDPTTFNFVRTIIKRRTGGQKQSTELTACQEAAAELQISNLVENPKGEGSAEVGGTSTTKISGDLDVTRAPEVVIELSEDRACAEQLEAAGSLPNPAKLEKEIKKVQEFVKSAHVVLYVGDDHIVRRISAQLTIESPKGSANNGAKSVEIDLDLTLTGVNEEQTISAPQGSQPLSNLFVKLGVNPLELLSLLQGKGGGLNSPGGLSGLLEGFAAGGTQ